MVDFAFIQNMDEKSYGLDALPHGSSIMICSIVENPFIFHLFDIWAKTVRLLQIFIHLHLKHRGNVNGMSC